MPGMTMSVMTTSGTASLMNSSASAPLVALSTTQSDSLSFSRSLPMR